MRRLSIPGAMHPEQRPCEGCDPAHMGTVHGAMLRYPPDTRNERFISVEKRNDRTNLWKCQRKIMDFDIRSWLGKPGWK